MPQKNVSCLIFLRLKYICIISICVYYYTLKDLRKFLGYTLKTVNALKIKQLWLVSAKRYYNKLNTNNNI